MELSQVMTSKHLGVLRDNGFVSVDAVAQQRIYRLDQSPFVDLETWIAPYRALWTDHLDALERHLDTTREHR